MVRLLSLVCLGALTTAVVLTGDTQAADRHHGGHDKLGKRIEQNGKHEIHRTAQHVVHAHVQNKKVTGVTATHMKTGKQAQVLKYKSARKHHAMLDNAGGDVHYVSMDTEEVDFTVWVGFGFVDNGHLVIFWFPIDWVDGGDSGAIDYETGI
jgi:hypothetical protein